MIGIDLYPTPENVIEKMLLGIEVQNKTVLEPSAGLGNIVDFVTKRGAKEVLACEIDPRLRKILSGKCRILKNDFLELTKEEVSHIDLIVMNPPFGSDENHILHAYEIAPEGCVIVSLCNESLITNAYSEKRRKLKELISTIGRSENFGSCFSNSERKTDVKVSCIWLYKEGSNDSEFNGYFDLTEEQEASSNQDGIVRYDYLRDIVGRYINSVKMFDSVEQATKTISSSIDGITTNFSISFEPVYRNRDNPNYYQQVTRAFFKKELQKAAWASIFAKFQMEKYVTKGVMGEINKFVEQQQAVPFTVSNIYRIIHLIAGTHGERMGKVLIEAFEKICSFSADNSSAGEKWKTNSDYMVNRKFIIPYICENDNRWPSATVNISHRRADEMDDIVKALCLLAGKKYEKQIGLRTFFAAPYKLKDSDGEFLGGYHNCFSSLGEVIIKDGVEIASRYDSAHSKRIEYAKKGIIVEVVKTNNNWGEWVDWGFFRVKGHKKGTMHFEFLDEELWAKFNLEVAKAKGWALPKNTKKAGKK